MAETISFRSRIPKRELQKRFGNVGQALNRMIAREMSSQTRRRTLTEILNDPNRPVISDKDYARCLIPE